MTNLADPELWVSLATLTLMEVVLGIDNVVFIAILTGRLPPEDQARARRIGLFLAMFARLALLFSISWVMSLRDPLFAVLQRPFSGRDLILLGGGIFLIGKATHEIHQKLEGAGEDPGAPPKRGSFASILGQIIVLDVVFSLDSVITAVGMAQSVAVMAVAMVIAVGVMLVFAGRISTFVERHPTVKVLALSFLILIGVMLVAEGMGQHIGKGYIYFAMAFSLMVELINLRVRKAHAPTAR